MLRLAAFAMGTRFEVVLEGVPPARLRAAGEAALEEIALWEQRLSRFRSDSLARHLERHAVARAVALDGEVLELLERCEEVRRASKGAFAIARPSRGEGAPGRAGVPQAAAPGAAEQRECLWIERLDAPAGEPRGAVRLVPGTRLDFGAVGKGFALDCARERLREAGVPRALLHGGTSAVATLGAPPGLGGWRVALEAGGPVVDLRDAALGVSAQHGGHGARDGGHVDAPRGGPPPPADRVAAVVHASALLADAWSTALLVLGILPEGAPRGLAALVGEGPPGARRWQVSGAASAAPLPDPSRPTHLPRARRAPTRA